MRANACYTKAEKYTTIHMELLSVQKIQCDIDVAAGRCGGGDDVSDES